MIPVYTPFPQSTLLPVLLNERAHELCDRLEVDAELLQIAIGRSACGTRIIDAGIHAPGGLEAGRRLAEICLAGLGAVHFVPAQAVLCEGPAVQVNTDQPLRACMASQYAGWQVSEGKFFAMGSGPMRAAGSKEPLFEKIGCRETSQVAVGVLETRKLPPDSVCQAIARNCRIAPDRLTLLVAPTASLAGTVQVVARSVETAMHKLFELGFDLSQIVAGYGLAPLPPIGKDDLAAIGMTNDAILYGAHVEFWVRGDDKTVETLGPRVPSSASNDFGQPFVAIFERYDRDFYKIDPHLFSPASVTFQNLETGHRFSFGNTHPRVIHESFGNRKA
jgi:methenyltetrahydromethanopterin cyclohydrolase